jgi:hypothetical protein
MAAHNASCIMGCFSMTRTVAGLFFIMTLVWLYRKLIFTTDLKKTRPQS